ncbi:MAG: CDP-glycerol glycerophosphotransferase family protein [Mogibacterium sp.]|nr:CDP-glycerol glycerophosphotransferase family protein [Mogibacterium sp.]
MEHKNNVLISVVMMDTVGEVNAPAVLECLRQQTYAPVEILADEALREFLGDASDIKWLPHVDNGSEFIKAAVGAAKGIFIQIIDIPVFPGRDLLTNLHAIMMENQTGGFPVFVTVPLVHTPSADADGSAEQAAQMPAHAAVFTEDYVHNKMVSAVNQLDCLWANKLFYTEALKKKSIYFTGGLQKDLYRIYNASFYIKEPKLSLRTVLDNGLIKDYVNSRWIRLRADSLGKKGLAAARTLREDFAKTTFRKSLHQWRLRKTREAYRFYTRKIAYPRQYRKFSRAPIDPRKVVFVEIRFAKLSNSMSLLRDRFAASDNYDVHEWMLRQDNSRHRTEYKTAMDFIKDAATARYIVCAEGTDVLGCLDVREGTYVLQTWHGCGAVKKCGFSTADMQFGRNLKTQLRYPLFNNFDMVTVASPEHIWVLEDAMHLQGQGLVKPIGVSRTDVFFDPQFLADARERVYAAVPAARDKKLILYSPTFRGEMSTAVSPEDFDYRAMADGLSDEYIVLVKHHPLVKIRPEIPEDLKGTFAFDVTDTVSIEDLICTCDICITDYSSIFFEFSLFERPVLFYAADRVQYAAERGMYYDYDNFVPGEIFDDTAGMVEYIKDIDNRFDRDRIRKFKELYMSSCDGHATDRILAAMGAEL